LRRVIEGKIDIAGHRIDGKPLVEAVYRERQLVGDGPARQTSGAAIVEKERKMSPTPSGRLVQPRAVETAADAGRSNGRIAPRIVSALHGNGLGGNEDLERNGLRGDDRLLAPRGAAIETTDESDGVGLEVVPAT